MAGELSIQPDGGTVNVAASSDGTPNAGAKSGEGQAGTPASFEEWIGSQGDDVKGLVTGHTSKLQSALQDERTQRKTLQKQVEDLSKAAEAGSQFKTQLDKISAEMAAMSVKTAFLESAPADCTNVRLAFLAATDAGLLNDDGKVDWAKLKATAPELFRKVVPAGNAGSGAGTPPPNDGKSMNSFLRVASGRGG